jgi:exopolyphosphatase/guanosine-5'-triphosphate,3'-diphosphate pyrophosphatase
LLELAAITRLGRGVDRTGVLEPAAIERTLACIERYATALREHRVEHLDAVGTSALRDAANAEDFVGPAEKMLGARPRVVTGVEEASLTFEGALSGLSVDGQVAVVDIGGGSTEFVLRRVGNALESETVGVSVDVGSVRLTERHCSQDPPSAAELDALGRDVSRALAVAPTAAEADHLVAVAGTATTLAALELGLTRYDPASVHGFALSRTALASWVQRLASLPLDQRRLQPGLEPARADVIVAGAVLLLAIVDRAGKRVCTVSDRGVRWGLIERLRRQAI